MKCWICGSTADSREHRIKKADLVRAYGRGPYTGPRRPIHVSGGARTAVQGPGSGRLKYSPTVCHSCNTSKTQQFDRAYDRFASWIIANEERVRTTRTLDFDEIFGGQSNRQRHALFAYFAKSFGCRLVYSRQPVPNDLIGLMTDPMAPTKLEVCFADDPMADLLQPHDLKTYIAKGPLFGYGRMPAEDSYRSYSWDESVGWLATLFWYGPDELRDTWGDPWTGNEPLVRVGDADSATYRAHLHL